MRQDSNAATSELDLGALNGSLTASPSTKATVPLFLLSYASNTFFLRQSTASISSS